MEEELEEQEVQLHPLSNIKITKYSNYEPRFNGIFSRNNLPKINDGAYVTNLNNKILTETQYIL